MGLDFDGRCKKFTLGRRYNNAGRGAVIFVTDSNSHLRMIGARDEICKVSFGIKWIGQSSRSLPRIRLGLVSFKCSRSIRLVLQSKVSSAKFSYIWMSGCDHSSEELVINVTTSVVCTSDIAKQVRVPFYVAKEMRAGTISRVPPKSPRVIDGEFSSEQARSVCHLRR